MLPAVANAEDVDLAEIGPAFRAPKRPTIGPRRLGELTGVPVRSLDVPRHDVLEAAERGPAGAGRLVDAVTVVGVNHRSAPAAAGLPDPLHASLGRRHGRTEDNRA